ncbi:hypothetical protein E4P40_04270 [Blastococcus sp. CT_GayMR20]|nr:hypothetical protein E4P40_04125 [Blastococcus sp. CT_GayMR20]TFV91974.1 hypothetical protein E4P40_04270 [Blastococcus sp. CT_GayMR20]
MAKLTPAQVAEWLAESCAAQGVPVRVTDPQVLGQVAALLPPPVGRPRTARSAGRGGPGRRHSRQTARTRDGSSDRAPS